MGQGNNKSSGASNFSKKKKAQRDKKSKLSKRMIRDLSRSEDLKIEGEHEEALEIAQKVLMKDPSCLAAAEEIADNYLSMDMHQQALKAANFAYSLDDQSYVANYIVGFVLLTSGDNESSLPFLRKANELRSNNPEILRCLGWGLFHTNNELMGLATLERALNLRSDDPLILCDLGVCLLHLNEFEKTIHLFERALALDPENERALECLEAANELKQEILLREQMGEKEFEQYMVMKAMREEKEDLARG